MADTVVVNGAPDGLAGSVAGLRAVVRAFPDYHWDLRHLLVDEPWVSAHFVGTGTNAVPTSAWPPPA